MGELRLDPMLAWRREPDGIRLVSGTRVKPDKLVRFSGEKYDSEFRDGYFELWRVPPPLVRAWRRRRGDPEEKYEESWSAFPDPNHSERYISDPIPLPSPGFRLQRTYRFRDSLGNTSGLLRVIAFASVDVGLPLGAIAGAMTGAPIDSGDLGTTIVTAVDPTLRLDVLTPWGEGPLNLRDHLREVAADWADDPADTDHLHQELAGMLEEYLPERPPEGWDMEFAEQNITMAEGEARRVPLRIRTPTPGAIAFAVQAANTDDPEQASVSDVAILVASGEQPPELMFP
jgi:hypothetical protein